MEFGEKKKKKTVNIITIIAFALFKFSTFFSPFSGHKTLWPPHPHSPSIVTFLHSLTPIRLYPFLISYYNYMNVKMKSNPNFQILKRKPHKANHKGKLTKFQTVPAHSDFAKSFPHSHAHHNTHTHTHTI